MISSDRFQKIEVTSAHELRQWLLKNHSQPESVWLVTYKKHTGAKYVSTAEVLDELICFGWIDGIRRKGDEARTLQLISPRKVEHWAQSYKVRAARLIREGKMHAAGKEAMARSKKQGLWDFMNDVDKLRVPADLKKALAQKPAAQAFFEALNDSSKRFVLRWLKLAKTDKTRTARIQKLVMLSERGEKLKGS